LADKAFFTDIGIIPTIMEPPSATFRAQSKLMTDYGRKIAINAIKDENEALM
jgi:hypothetical protein